MTKGPGPSTMGQGSEKIELSWAKSWDTFQNDQHKLHFTLDIAVSARHCKESVKPGKHAQIDWITKINGKLMYHICGISNLSLEKCVLHCQFGSKSWLFNFFHSIHY